MPNQMRLRPLRVCAVMAALWAPLVASAGPAVDTNALRQQLKAIDARSMEDAGRAADVGALRLSLGLVKPTQQTTDSAASQGPAPLRGLGPSAQPTPVEQPASLAPAVNTALVPLTTRDASPAQSGGSPLFVLQNSGHAAPVITTAPAQGAVPSSLGAGGLFVLQQAMPKPLQEPVARVVKQPLIQEPAPQDAANLAGISAAATSTTAQTSPGGGLFVLHNNPQTTGLRGTGARDLQAASSLAQVTTNNFRLMLATLAQNYSGANNLSVVTAQGARGPIGLSVKSGTVTLDDLKRVSSHHGYPPRPDGSMTMPIVIWPDATLRLDAGDRLGLARDTGAFVLSLGRIEVTDAVIETTGPENPHEKHYSPFVTIASGGSLQIEGATVRGLGFGRTLKFAGLTVAGNPLMPQQQDVVIRNTLFSDTGTLTIAGAPHAVVDGNTFEDARNNALNVVGSPYAKIRGNLFRGKSPTNAIRVDVGSDYAAVSDNVILKGERLAVLVQSGANNVYVQNNLIWRRDGGGIKFYNSRCGNISDNILVDLAQKGIEVRKSNGIVVRENLIAGGRSAAIWVSAQAKNAQTVVQGNLFERNAAGLSAATGADIWTAGNNFRQQLPKLLGGDIAALTHAISRDLEGARTLQLTNGRSILRNQMATLCGDGL